MSFTASAVLLAWVAIVLMALVLAGLLRQVHELRQTVPHARRSRRSHPFDGSALSEQGIEVDGVRLLLLLDNECSTCTSIVTELPYMLSAAGLHATVLVYEGSEHAQASATGAQVVGHADDVFHVAGASVLPFAAARNADGSFGPGMPIGSVAELQTFLRNNGLRVKDERASEWSAR